MRLPSPCGLLPLRVQSDPRATIELERLPSLKVLSADRQQVQGSIRFAPLLERLFLGHYAPQDFTALGALPSIVSVVMKDYPQVRSLDGIEDMPWLVKLGVDLAKNLEEITALQRSSSPVLEILQLPSCRRVADVAPVASCTSLRFFELSEGAEIRTVAPSCRRGRGRRRREWNRPAVVDLTSGHRRRPTARRPTRCPRSHHLTPTVRTKLAEVRSVTSCRGGRGRRRREWNRPAVVEAVALAGVRSLKRRRRLAAQAK